MLFYPSNLVSSSYLGISSLQQLSHQHTEQAMLYKTLPWDFTNIAPEVPVNLFWNRYIYLIINTILKIHLFLVPIQHESILFYHELEVIFVVKFILICHAKTVLQQGVIEPSQPDPGDAVDEAHHQDCQPEQHQA